MNTKKFLRIMRVNDMWQ